MGAASGGANMTIVVGIIITLVALAVMAAFGFPYARRALLGWYAREVQRATVAETPDEAIVTYPLA
jgi:hypothetical protein